jgi:hypothetical protein
LVSTLFYQTIYLSVVVRVPVESNTIGIFYVSAMYAALNSKIKDWLVQMSFVSYNSNTTGVTWGAGTVALPKYLSSSLGSRCSIQMYLKQQTVYIYLSVVVRVPEESNTIGIFYVSAMYAALNSKIKDWLVRTTTLR